MRELHLIRHAKSSWDDISQRDFDRPLNERGARDAPRLARSLADDIERPVLLVSSPARRAWQTAGIFAEALGLADNEIHAKPAIYEASPGTLLELVNNLDNHDARVLLFGHNPGISTLARLLASCPFTEMPTCGIASIGFDCWRWQDVVPRHGKLLAYRFPRQDQ